MFDLFQPTHLLFVFVVALLLVGPKRMGELVRSLGWASRSLQEFKDNLFNPTQDDPRENEHPPEAHLKAAGISGVQMPIRNGEDQNGHQRNGHENEEYSPPEADQPSEPLRSEGWSALEELAAEWRELAAGGWKPHKREGEILWQSPFNGQTYPQEIAVAMTRTFRSFEDDSRSIPAESGESAPKHRRSQRER